MARNLVGGRNAPGRARDRGPSTSGCGGVRRASSLSGRPTRNAFDVSEQPDNVRPKSMTHRAFHGKPPARSPLGCKPWHHHYASDLSPSLPKSRACALGASKRADSIIDRRNAIARCVSMGRVRTVALGCPRSREPHLSLVKSGLDARPCLTVTSLRASTKETGRSQPESRAARKDR